jgi:hypothetical protein
MSNSCLGSIVGSLGLRYVDNCTRHATNHDNASWCISLHQMFGDSDSPEISTVNIDAPKLLHAIVGVRNGRVVLGESGGCDKIVDLAVLLDDFLYGLIY